jgi:hypothetical protein
MIARTPAGSGWEAQCKVRALTALVELGEAAPIAEDELRRLLEDVADSPPPGARGAQARLAVMEVLDRLDQPPDEEAKKIARLFDDRPDEELVAEDEWYPATGPDAHGWMKLFAYDTLGKRRRWYSRLAEGRVAEMRAPPPLRSLLSYARLVESCKLGAWQGAG